MFDFIPPQFRIVALIVAVVAVFSVGVTSGWTANGWRLNSGYQKSLNAKDTEIADLKIAIEKQNSSVREMKIKTDAAESTAAAVKVWAESMRKISEDKVAAAKNIKPTDCRTMVDKLKAVTK